VLEHSNNEEGGNRRMGKGVIFILVKLNVFILINKRYFLIKFHKIRYIYSINIKENNKNEIT